MVIGRRDEGRFQRCFTSGMGGNNMRGWTEYRLSTWTKLTSHQLSMAMQRWPLPTPPEEISLNQFLLCILLCIYIFNM